MTANRPKAKILVDGGDPAETSRIKELFDMARAPSGLCKDLNDAGN